MSTILATAVASTTKAPVRTAFLTGRMVTRRTAIEGAPSTEKTEVWVLFDDTNIYIACRCWDEHPELIVANSRPREG